MELDISNEVIVGIAVVIYGIILYLLSKPKKNPSVKKGRVGGPTWARTRDQLIMSQLL